MPDACFIAKHGDKYIGFTDLIRYEMVAGGITQGFTGVAREYRRRGVATALKLRAIEYACKHGYQTIRAFSYPSQASIIALNEKLGFRRAFIYITVEKWLKEIAKIDCRIYDAYAGRYAFDTESSPEHDLPSDMIVCIKRVGDHLMSEARDIQDELYPESEIRFFTQNHYGQIEFVRDEQERVTHLVYRENGKQLRANKIE